MKLIEYIKNSFSIKSIVLNTIFVGIAVAFGISSYVFEIKKFGKIFGKSRAIINAFSLASTWLLVSNTLTIIMTSDVFEPRRFKKNENKKINLKIKYTNLMNKTTSFEEKEKLKKNMEQEISILENAWRNRVPYNKFLHYLFLFIAVIIILIMLVVYLSLK